MLKLNQRSMLGKDQVELQDQRKLLHKILSLSMIQGIQLQQQELKLHMMGILVVMCSSSGKSCVGMSSLRIFPS